MALVLRLTSPSDSMWFGISIKRWVENHPEYNNYFDIIDSSTISVKVDRLEIGRQKNNKVVLDNKLVFSGVSRKHALIVREGGKWFLVDQRSKYGTWVRIKGEIVDVRTLPEPISLKQGYEIILGKLQNKSLEKPITLLVVAV